MDELLREEFDFTVRTSRYHEFGVLRLLIARQDFVSFSEELRYFAHKNRERIRPMENFSGRMGFPYDEKELSGYLDKIFASTEGFRVEKELGTKVARDTATNLIMRLNSTLFARETEREDKENLFVERSVGLGKYPGIQMNPFNPETQSTVEISFDRRMTRVEIENFFNEQWEHLRNADTHTKDRRTMAKNFLRDFDIYKRYQDKEGKDARDTTVSSELSKKNINLTLVDIRRKATKMREFVEKCNDIKP
ncbi:MAG: hypothetical protein CMI56_02230 [Parcubacteria group bacterium]|nr:hypothetical protein [Parcubacteria group bacterium]